MDLSKAQAFKKALREAKAKSKTRVEAEDKAQVETEIKAGIAIGTSPNSLDLLTATPIPVLPTDPIVAYSGISVADIFSSSPVGSLPILRFLHPLGKLSLNNQRLVFPCL